MYVLLLYMVCMHVYRPVEEALGEHQRYDNSCIEAQYSIAHSYRSGVGFGMGWESK